MNKEDNKNIQERAPVVVVMGHVDHGKSTLLDYIRKSNTTDKEVGGITQDIRAYEVIHKDENGIDKSITFIDTPGHEAFSGMRECGARIADIAILIVSAEDSVKVQTLEAYNTIIENKIPYIVAINKIDKPNANVNKVKVDLAEKGIYLEGQGGDIPFVLISAKEGTGISELQDMILLVSEMAGFKGDRNANASGIIIEANREPKRGIQATCIIKDGTLHTSMYVVSGSSMVNTQIVENFLGKNIKEATFSSPIRLIGFDSVPVVGSTFVSFKSKKEAEKYIKDKIEDQTIQNNDEESESQKYIPLLIKADVAGSLEAIKKEINKLNNTDISFKIIGSGIGAISESDIKTGSIKDDTIIVGFNTKVENNALDLNQNTKVEIQTFDIIYKLTDYLKEILDTRRIRKEVKEVTGKVKILKTFSTTGNKHVVGGKVIEGYIGVGNTVRIMRRDFEVGTGKILELQTNKIKTKEVQMDNDCGMLVDSRLEISSGDVLESFIIKMQ